MLLNLTMELTARCNNNCSQCYINLPETDQKAIEQELTFEQIKDIIDESVSMGTLWVLLSGGEPLLRPDFFDIYTYIRQSGLLVSVFTNAALITQDHIDLFKKYPPRDIEVTVYGVTPKTHQKVTRVNTFTQTMAGIDLLFENELPVKLKSTITRSNVHEIEQIAQFCTSKTKQTFRFDPILHLRLDRDHDKNLRIASQRLSPDEIYEIDRNDSKRYKTLVQKCKDLPLPSEQTESKKIFSCRAGINSGCVDHTGLFKPCTSMNNEYCLYDLTTGSLDQAWYEFVPGVINMKSKNQAFIESCGSCHLQDICSWCPAHADLETGKLIGQTPYFCKIAKKRNSRINNKLFSK